MSSLIEIFYTSPKTCNHNEHMKILKFMTILMVLTKLSVANSGEDLVCENLAKLTCAPGDYNDGTGTARNATLDDDEMKKIQSKVIARAKEKFKSILSDPKNTSFRSAVLSAAGLSVNTECQGAEDIAKPTESCLNLLLTGIGDITAKKMMAFQPDFRKYKPDESGNFSDEVYVVDSREFAKVEEQILAEMKPELKIDELDKKVKEVVFPKVKELLMAKIPTMVQNPALQRKLLNKIREIEFDGSNCPFRDRESKEKLSDFLIPNAFYMPNQKDFKYCSGLALQNKSEFQIAFIIAHELTHSIDPCGVSMGPHDFTFRYPPGLNKKQAETVYPLADVIGCLRGAESVLAMDLNTFEEKKRQEVLRQMRVPQQPNDPQDDGPPDPTNRSYFCNRDDQITEALPDWMAAEILPDYMKANHSELTQEQFRKGYSNVWRGLCNDNSDEMFDEHPHIERRINNNLLVQPKIRQQMGCSEALPPDRVYCKHNVNYDGQSGGSVKSGDSGPATNQR